MAVIQAFIPNYRTSDGMSLQHITNSIQYAAMEHKHQIGVGVHSGALIEASRNTCVAKWHPSAEFLLFIDDDMKPAQDAVAKIVALNRPIATALCTTRTEPVHLALKKWNEAERGYEAWLDYAPTSIIEGNYGVGAAFLCIRRDAMKEILGYYMTAQDWLDWNRPMLDRLKVRAELREQERARREALRRKNWKEKGYLRVFEQAVHDGSELSLGEDVVFCWRAMQCGIPVTVDPTIRVGHKGDKDYYVEDFIPPNHLKNFTSESLGLKELLTA